MWWDMGRIRESNTEELPPNGFDIPDVRKLGPFAKLEGLGSGVMGLRADGAGGYINNLCIIVTYGEIILGLVFALGDSSGKKGREFIATFTPHPNHHHHTSLGPWVSRKVFILIQIKLDLKPT